MNSSLILSSVSGMGNLKPELEGSRVEVGREWGVLGWGPEGGGAGAPPAPGGCTERKGGYI